MKSNLKAMMIAILAIPTMAACQLGGSQDTSSGVRPTDTSPAARVVSPTTVADTSASLPERQPTQNTNIALNQPGQEPAQQPTDVPESPQQGGAQATTSPISPAAPGSDQAVPQVVRSVSGAVVQIIAETPQGSGTGSGFIIDKQGHIITNNHVVEGANRVFVVHSGTKISRARVIGADQLSDIAVVRIENKNLPTARLGDSRKLQVGERVVAIGSALGMEGAPTVSTGVVSALSRTAREPAGDPTDPQDDPLLVDLIQTDTAINPGNSGGPLLNLRGEVIGVNTLGQRSAGSGVPVQGINFAVSVNTARSVAQEIITQRRATYPYMGVRASFITPRDAIEQGVPYIPGQLVAEVLPGTPAARAGIRQGDIIVAINGQRIENESAFIVMLREKEPGDRITVTILRNKQELEKSLTLAELEE